MANPAPTAITADDGVRVTCAIASAITDAITSETVEMGEVPAAADRIPQPEFVSHQYSALELVNPVATPVQ